MPPFRRKPHVFIGSASAAKHIAQAIQVAIADEAETQIWNEGVFTPGGSFLALLKQEAQKSDFAILVVTPDDVQLKNGTTNAIPRDNIIFELGLFMGELGSERTFLFYSNGANAPKLPSDLLGIVHVDFTPTSSERLLSDVSMACFAIKQGILRLGPRRNCQRLAAMPGPSSVAVFLPDWDGDKHDEFYQDGAAQKKGFDQALHDTQWLPSRLSVGLERMQKDESADEILERMKKLYAEENAIYFILTMSSKVTNIRFKFSTWRNECRTAGYPAPVLIATVTSAPDVADADLGLVRWYVRSKEESTMLAEYLRWKEQIERADIFFVTHTPGQQDSPYGVWGMRTFKHRFESLGGKIRHAYGVTAATADSWVTRWAETIATINNKEKSAVFVVGYGNMLRNTVSAIVSHDLDIRIACTSTLTSTDWQPAKGPHDARIVTVMPRLKNPTNWLDGDDRNVVFLFAKETLRRVLQLTANHADPNKFLELWKSGECAKLAFGADEFDQEHLVSGDIVVHVDIADATRWRA